MLSHMITVHHFKKCLECNTTFRSHEIVNEHMKKDHAKASDNYLDVSLDEDRLAHLCSEIEREEE